MTVGTRVGVVLGWLLAGMFAADAVGRLVVHVPEFARVWCWPGKGDLFWLPVAGFCAMLPYGLMGMRPEAKLLSPFLAAGWFWTALVADVAWPLVATKDAAVVLPGLGKALAVVAGLPYWGAKLVLVGLEREHYWPVAAGALMLFAAAGMYGLPRYFVWMALPGCTLPRLRRPAAAQGTAGPAVSAAPSQPGRKRDPKAFDRLVGLDEAIEVLKDALELPVTRPDLVKKYRLQPPRGLLLAGPPGTGKTSLARAAAAYFGCAFADVSVPELLGPYVGEAERLLHGRFEWARQHAPCILFFDEIDAIAGRRDGRHMNRPQDLLLNVLLEELDGFRGREGVFVMAATNRPDMLDEALLRPGRFDRVVHLGLPGPEARQKLFRLYLEGRPVDPGLDYAALAARAEGKSPAEIKDMCDRAALSAARREGNITMADFGF